MAVKLGGLSWDDARAMDSTERKAAVYLFAEMDGNTVNWETGEIRAPRTPEVER